MADTIKLGKKAHTLRPAESTSSFASGNGCGLAAVEKLGKDKLPLGNGRKAGSAVNG